MVQETQTMVNNKKRKLTDEHKLRISKSLSGRILSEEHKRKLSLANIGKKLSKEYKEKIRLANTGHLVSDETKIKIGIGNKGKNVSKESRMKISISHQGKKLSEETKNKIRLTNTGFKHSDETKQKLKEINLGNIFTQEHKDNIRKSKLGKSTWNKGKKMPEISGENNYFYGKHHSIKSKQLIRERKIGKITWMKGKHHTEESKIKLRESNILYCKNHPEAIIAMKERRKLIILPKKDTTIEVKIQNYLTELGIEFYTHKYMNILHGYQCDIFIPSLNLVIECDGMYWHSYPTGRDIDYIRTKELIEKGFKVLRIWEVDIRKMSISDFKERIENVK
jgi:very-short-patch-repair endonuclease